MREIPPRIPNRIPCTNCGGGLDPIRVDGFYDNAKTWVCGTCRPEPKTVKTEDRPSLKSVMDAVEEGGCYTYKGNQWTWYTVRSKYESLRKPKLHPYQTLDQSCLEDDHRFGCQFSLKVQSMGDKKLFHFTQE